MMNFLKKNWVTVLIVLATLVLAGIAIFTALRLYQLRQQPVAPTAPSSKPAAAGPSTQCTTSFTLGVVPSGTASPSPTGTATASPSGTASPSPTGTPTPPLSCGDACSSNADCTNNMVCSNGLCRNPSCLSATNCICATATPTPTATPSGTATAAPSLPESGTSYPAIIGVVAGILLLVGAFVLAL